MKGHPFIVLLNFKSHVTYHLFYDIGLDSRSIFFIVDKEEDSLSILNIGEDVECYDPCTTRLTLAFRPDGHTNFAYVFL